MVLFYYSYLLSYGTDNRSRVSFGSSTNIDQVRVQGIADGTLRVYVGSSFTAGASLAGDTDYLVVGRITTNAAGDDEHRIWVYSSSQTIALSDPGTAGSYAAQTGSLSGTASMVQFSNILNAGYGDFRMGTTWEAVVIPEPSTYAAIFGLLAFAGVILLRRRKQ
ncbi:MAG: PEP-CTERM sorting domain-containing protein [Verrucomicrobia bacterium]|nr:PEP-CTERM sorting domain-containing protein [Verrucomicrobiota bacterium]